MKRRRFIALAGATTGIAGCQGFGSANETETGSATEATATGTETATPTPRATDTATDTPTETPTPTPEPASFTVESFSAPESAELGQSFNLTVSVTNSGELDGTFDAGVETRTGRDDFSAYPTNVQVSVPAGETVTTEITVSDGVDHLTTFDARLATTGQTTATEIIGRKMTFGESYTMSSDVRFGIQSIDFVASYSDGALEDVAADGHKYAIVNIVAENEGNSLATAPYSYNVKLIANGSEYENELTTRHEDGYRGGDLFAGTRREGVIPYEIPKDVLLDDIRVAWSGGSHTEPIALYWSDD